AGAAESLRAAILAELPDLKLGQADFMVSINPASVPSAAGNDEVVFNIKTNPGTPFAALHKIASGGELARLMLALRVVLMKKNNTNKTFIFDEIDTGISGGTAAAVGQRLARLAANGQAIVITHSAQVAGQADNHFLIAKNTDGNATTTTVREIAGDARISEIARIISGEKITDESIATARTLIKS
ncbi:MAG: DNA repair protein RecN, partial [Rickettsiales bacterium]|nr:DNA repair protein RecN [Rickettsiales bacterium]